MNKQDVYKLLEEKMMGYTDYIDVPVEPNNESFVPISANDKLIARQIDTDMRAYSGEQIFVRGTVLQKLQQASRSLSKQGNSLQLEVVYGYRALEIQKRLFEKYKAELEPQYSGNDLLAAVHRLVAVPEVAGHPAGAAVDIQITRNGKPLDFGTRIHEFTPDTFTFSPFINKEAWQNRQLLRRVMMRVGFAPFDGEWWHFSYGDKEWAKYYGEPAAKYEQCDLKTDDSSKR